MPLLSHLLEELELLCDDPGKLRLNADLYDAVLARAMVCRKDSEDEAKSSEKVEE